jgi:large subunit ribosomal protein L18
MASVKQEKRRKRQARIRAKISGTTRRPRLALFRSNKHIYAQLIDDDKHITLVSLSDKDISKAKNAKGLEDAKKFGELLAKKTKDAKITKVVFDRRGYAYHGIIQAIAEAARQGGLEF